MMWLVKARVRPGADDALVDEITGGLAGGQPFAKELHKALDQRPAPGAAFYFPVEGRDPEAALGRTVLSHLEVLGKTRVKEVTSGWADEEEDERPRHAARGRPKPAPRHRRASEEDD